MYQYSVISFARQSFAYRNYFSAFGSPESEDSADPAFGPFNPAHLDTGQGIIQFLGNGPHFLHAAGETDLFAVIHDLAHRADHRRCAADLSLIHI